MAKDFSDVIHQSLIQMGPEILEERVRFLAVIQDLGKDFQQERKLLSRCMDDKFLSLCVQAKTSSPDQLPAIQKRVREYMEHEYMVSHDWSDRIAHAMVYGIGRYFHGNAVDEKSAEEQTKPRKTSEKAVSEGDQTVVLDSIMEGAAAAGAAPASQPLENRAPLPPSTGAASAKAASSSGYRPDPSPAKSSGRRKPLIIGAAICLGIILGIVAFVTLGSGDDTDSEEDNSKSTATELSAEDIKILDQDANFSQITHPDNDRTNRELSFEKDGVDFLIEVENNGDTDLRCFEFTAWQEDTQLENKKDESDSFRAYGLVEAGDVGYMYCKLYLDNSTSYKIDVEAEIKEIIAEDNPQDFQLCGGSLGAKHKENDTYDVFIDNDTDCTLHKKHSTVIVVQNDHNGLGSSWGAGKLDSDIGPGEKKTVSGCLYNPGLTASEDHSYRVFVIDNSYLK